MRNKLKSIPNRVVLKARQFQVFLASPKGERGEESASVAAITGLVLLIIIAVMSIFRSALISTFNRITELLGF